MNNNCDYRDDKSCYFHPKEVVTGVCHLCLNERLIVLASKQTSHLYRAKNTSFFRSHSMSHHDQKPPATGATLPRIFAIGSLLNRFEFLHRKSDDLDFSDASSSLEDSFISIKFENNNGVGSWEKNTNTVSLEHCNISTRNHNLVSNDGNNKGSTKTSVVEHVKPRGSAMRWSKRIGHLFQLSKWKRSNKASVCHVGGKLEGAKVRNSGWIRSLTKRRTKE